MADGNVEAFITRWQGRVGGQERANYALFLSELADALGVERPEPSSADTEANDYVFERVVADPGRDGAATRRRIDLYRRSCFVLEAKQSRQPSAQANGQAALFAPEPTARGRRSADRAWDVLMMNARRQAENYVRLLAPGHEAPPFVLVCDVGHCLELYANFRQDGKAYDQFPDRSGFRIYLEDLRRPEIRERLRLVWTDPRSLDPSLNAARVTRGIAERLAAVSRRLEAKGSKPAEVAQFLMRAIFTMFAEDVELIPKNAFRAMLDQFVEAPDGFAATLAQAWKAMDGGGYAIGFKAEVKRFNGSLFRDAVVIPFGREEIGELRAAAAHDWREVEPAIFGALLEQALDPAERRKLGAHYTPRAYVERLVVATVIEPLRDDWAAALATAERQRAEAKNASALKTVRGFHDRLCALKVLDPACGTANFLYVTLELLKRLEGEVLEALADLGGQEALSGLEGHTVDPGQMLGLEVNARATAIAELVLWIGYLQWHARTRGGAPGEPILRAFGNIRFGDAVLDNSRSTPARPEWPEADFIVGNPPFIGGKDLRSRLGPAYTQALWAAHGHINESADYVMYWWDRAAEILTRKGTRLRRFGFVTTNSIAQVFQRRVVEKRLGGRQPVSIVMAIPDHPWTKAAPDHAAVRIAMTVVESGVRDGALRRVVVERGLETDAPVIELLETRGRINADLTVGADVSKAAELRANASLCSPGVKLHGAGFIVRPLEAKALGLGRRRGLARHIRPYRNGRDLTGRSRGVLAIDLFELGSEEVRRRFPEVYQHLTMTVKEARVEQHAKSPTKDAAAYLEEWWLFGKPRPDLRAALQGLTRYIATVETAKHRLFQFLDISILPDNMLVAIGSDDAFHLGVLSSRIHEAWALRAGGRQGVGNDPRYSKSRCFDPFPFPEPQPTVRAEIAAVAEEIDAHRKRAFAEHPWITLTALYNVAQMLRAGVSARALDEDDRAVCDAGLVLILNELHARLDRAVAQAYGWPVGLSADEAVARLVALNAERTAEEARGNVRFLRPAFQRPRFAPAADAQAEAERGRQADAPLAATAPGRPTFPRDEVAQTATVMMALIEAGGVLDADDFAARFRDGRRAAPRIAATMAALARLGAVSSFSGQARFGPTV
jgi:hypothetical protein